MPQRLCPECGVNPSPDQRPQAKDGRCAACLEALEAERRRREDEIPYWGD